MLGLNLNIGSSVFKREAKEMETVINQLKRNGWEESGSMGDRVQYLENSQMSVTVINGVSGTLVVPSGPVRGKIFGDSGLDINQVSVIGAGSDSGDGSKGEEQKAANRVSQIT